MGILIQNTDTSGAVVYVGRKGASYCYAAQKINLAYNYIVTSISLYWGAKVSNAEYLSPSVSIVNDSGGLPMGSGIISVSAGSPANNAGWLTHTFATPSSVLVANTDYWIRVENGGSQSDENSNALTTASSGALKTSVDNTANWGDVARDLSYKVIGNRLGGNRGIIL